MVPRPGNGNTDTTSSPHLGLKGRPPRNESVSFGSPYPRVSGEQIDDDGLEAQRRARATSPEPLNGRSGTVIEVVDLQEKTAVIAAKGSVGRVRRAGGVRPRTKCLPADGQRSFELEDLLPVLMLEGLRREGARLEPEQARSGKSRRATSRRVTPSSTLLWSPPTARTGSNGFVCHFPWIVQRYSGFAANSSRCRQSSSVPKPSRSCAGREVSLSRGFPGRLPTD